MKKKSQQNRQFSECAYCGEHRKRTGEHRFPQWLIKILPLTLADKNHRHVTQIVTPNGFAIGHEPKLKKISGDPGSFTLPIVCGPCNSGWMSRLQTEAAPFLTPAIMGAWAKFSEVQRSISRWCLMTAMSSEFDHPETVSFSQRERDDLRRNLDLPHGVVIWIGKMNRQEQTRTCAHRAYFSTDGEGFPATTMHIGDFLFQVIKVTEVDIETIREITRHLKMRLLWPVTANCYVDAEPPNVDGIHMMDAHLLLLPFFENYLRGARHTAPRWRFDPSCPLEGP